MTVQEIFTWTDKTQKAGNQLSAESTLLAEAMVLASDATLENGEATGDPTEIAVLQLADLWNMDRKALLDQQPRRDELSFDSSRKMMSTLHQKEAEYVVYVKGAIDSLIARCVSIVDNQQIVSMTDTHKETILAAADGLSEKALRTLAAAFKTSPQQIDPKDFEQDLVFIGMVGMIDPPRKEVKDAIRTAKTAGIDTIIITGDHKNTAFAIAEDLGIAEDISQATTGRDINMMSPFQLQEHMKDYRVFARVSPENKVDIVSAFKRMGNIVSMTGDGVNDAPCLRAADIGIAMGIQRTDVARNASDMILAEDNFSTIITAIEQGRNIYNNIKKSVIFLLSCNLGEVITMMIASVAGLSVPLIATQLLWINLLTDTLPAVALGMDPGDTDIMKRRPKPIAENFFSEGVAWRVMISGVVIGLVTLGAFLLGYLMKGHHPFGDDISKAVHDYARTLAFLTIIASQLFYAFSFRHQVKSIFKVGLFSNKYLVGATLLGLGLQMLVQYLPMLRDASKLQRVGPAEWGMVLLLGLIPLLIDELIKAVKRSQAKLAD